ncbi:MAG TPA: septation protein SepH, partial [Acidimicrobiales bacterium]|nr:septation protein SepH [Acidimicrobiales bacterium]
MHQLHLVGFTADHDGLIFSTRRDATSGAYVVGIDDALFSALEEARRAAMAEPNDPTAQADAERVKALRPTQRSSLSVRDIQSRLRTGVTLVEVAAEAGVDEEWVARFAAPVLAEQAAVVERALPMTFTTNRKGASSRPLGDSVRWNLADRHIAVDAGSQAAGWTAFQLAPGQWGVRFSYLSRGRQQVAEWEVSFEADELTARNRLASELGYVEPGARRRPQPEPPAATPASTSRKASAGRPGRPARTGTARTKAAKATTPKAAKATTPKAARAASSKPTKVPATSSATRSTAAKSATKKATAAKAAAAKATAARKAVAAKATPAKTGSKKATRAKAASTNVTAARAKA